MHTPPSFSSVLPTQPTALVDRVSELAAIVHRLSIEGVRLLTLTGPAGVGKTRLALAAVAAEQVAERFPDGVIVVDLAPIREPSLVLPAIAFTLALADTGHPSLLERIRAFLSERAAVLLVLDNVEQVLPDAATVLADLLASCPGLAVLVTSRVPLQLRWEQTLRVPPLAVPALDSTLPPLEVLAQVPSVALFVERARARREDFVLTEKQAPLVAELVVQLDGLPLALELAAARLDVLSLPMLVRRLGDRLRLLVSEAPDRPARQQSLEAAVGWSYDLLSEPERQLFRCLGVFMGRVTFDAITAVVSAVSLQSDGAAAAASEAEVVQVGRTLPRLLSLAEKSLVLPARPEEYDVLRGQPGHEAGLEEEEVNEEDPEPAFGMLETVREYAQERLAAAGELATASHGHAHYFLTLAERAAAQLQGGAQRAWLLRLEREHDNLRAALGWLLDQGGSEGADGTPAEWEMGLRLAGALGDFWWRRGYHAEGERWLEDAFARVPRGEGIDPAVQFRALVALGRFLAVQGAFARARTVLEKGLELAEQWQDPAAIAEAHRCLGLSAVLGGEEEEGSWQLQEALSRWEALGDSHGVGLSRYGLGVASERRGDIEEATQQYTEALQRLGAVGDPQQAGFVHCSLGMAEWRRGELRSAVAQVQVAVQTSVNLQDRWMLSLAAGATSVLVSATQPPRWAQRARLLGAADALRQATGATLAWEGMPGGQEVVELRARLAPAEGEWEAAYREGRALRFGEVAVLALRVLEEVVQGLPHADHKAVAERAKTMEQTVGPLSPHRGRSPQSALTERDQQVLRLVADGLSSKAIGRQLFIAPSTVNYHLTSVFNKLGVDTRAQAVAVAAQRGLL